jgi:DNA-binding NarL/FixJ family response regulator
MPENLKKSGTAAARPEPPPPFSRVEWDHVTRELGLSPQQERIVALILSGKRDKQIATALGLSIATVRTY